MSATLTNTGTLQSIPDFCEENGISRAFFYKLKSQGKAPKIAKLGSRSVVTPKARQDWITSLDQDAEAQQ
jgi:predicted DNA-binding transcriptional regulator AlpA